MSDCEHIYLEGGYCQLCGEKIFTPHGENDEPVQNRASIEDYAIFVNDLKSLPNFVKDYVIERLREETNLPFKIGSAINLIYRRICEKELDLSDDSFLLSNVEKELKSKSKSCFGRKNINRSRKTNSSGSQITIHSPVKYVDAVCQQNQVPNYTTNIKEIIKKLIVCDRDKLILDISPEIAVIALLSLFNDKFGTSSSLNAYAKHNSVTPSVLKETKKKISAILTEHEITI